MFLLTVIYFSVQFCYFTNIHPIVVVNSASHRHSFDQYEYCTTVEGATKAKLFWCCKNKIAALLLASVASYFTSRQAFCRMPKSSGAILIY
jgi:hypothetical protein